MTLQQVTIALDTSTLWDIAQHREFRVLDKDTASSIRAFERCVTWLLHLNVVAVIATHATAAEYMNLIRDDHLCKHLLERQGLPTRSIAKYRKHYGAMRGSMREEFVRDFQKRVQNLGWIEFRWSVPDGDRLGSLLRQILQETSLSLEDAHVFSAALSHDTQVFVTSDTDYHEHMDEIVQCTPAVMLLDHRKFARGERDSLSKTNAPAKSREGRRELLRLVFGDFSSKMGGYTIGRCHQLRLIRGKKILQYFHTSTTNQVRRGDRIAIVGDSYYRFVRVERIEISNVELECVAATDAEISTLVGLELERDPTPDVIWDPSEPSLGDTVYLEPTCLRQASQ